MKMTNQYRNRLYENLYRLKRCGDKLSSDLLGGRFLKVDASKFDQG